MTDTTLPLRPVAPSIAGDTIFAVRRSGQVADESATVTQVIAIANAALGTISVQDADDVTISGGEATGLSELSILDTNSSYSLEIICGSDLTADHTLTFVTGDNDRSLTIGASASVSGLNTGDQTTVSGNAGTATALQTARTIGGTSFNGTADIVPATIIVADSVSPTCSVALFESATGNLAPKTDAGITYNATNGTLTTTIFAGSFTGNCDTATALQTGRLIGGVSFNGTVDIVPTTIVAANEGTDATCFPSFFTAATGDLLPKTNAALTFNSATANLGCTTFTGALTGNVTGNVSGLAGTATALATPHNIGGSAFNGTADITPLNTTVGNEASDTTCFPTFVTAATGDLPQRTNAALTFNSSTGALGATLLGGTLTTASQTNITGVGTVTVGVWDGTDVAVSAGGTGLGTITSNALIKGNGTSAMVVTGVTIDSADGISGYTGVQNIQTGTTYTVAASDTGKIVTLNNAGAITVTVPNSLVAGFTCDFIQLGAGQVTFAAGASATQRSYSSNTKLEGQYAGGSILVTSNAGSAAVYVLTGQLVA